MTTTEPTVEQLLAANRALTQKVRDTAKENRALKKQLDRLGVPLDTED